MKFNTSEHAYVEQDRLKIEGFLRNWFPAPAVVKCGKIGDYRLLSEEYQYISTAARRRKQEFSTGRFLSRQCLQSLNLAETPIHIGKLHNPIWPKAVIGSISHDGDLCCVVILPKSKGNIRGIGIDLVHLTNQNNNINGLSYLFLSSANEYHLISDFNTIASPDLLIFSLKEAAVKAISLEIQDFIDIKSLNFRNKGCSKVIIGGASFDVETHAGTTENYLITAVVVNDFELSHQQPIIPDIPV